MMTRAQIRTEKDLWSKVLRPVLHKPAKGRVAYKVQDAFVKGLPDVIYNDLGRVVWLELKITPMPVRPGTPFRIKATPEQRRFMNEWARAEGFGVILTYDPREDCIWLFPPSAPEEIVVSHGTMLSPAASVGIWALAKVSRAQWDNLPEIIDFIDMAL